MQSQKITIPAIHDWHLNKVLSDLGLLSEIEANKVRCHKCNILITVNNIGGLLVLGNNKYALLCDGTACLVETKQ